MQVSTDSASSLLEFEMLKNMISLSKGKERSCGVIAGYESKLAYVPVLGLRLTSDQHDGRHCEGQ